MYFDDFPIKNHSGDSKNEKIMGAEGALMLKRPFLASKTSRDHHKQPKSTSKNDPQNPL